MNLIGNRKNISGLIDVREEAANAGIQGFNYICKTDQQIVVRIFWIAVLISMCTLGEYIMTAANVECC